jgi:hypothetical protein
MAALSSAKMGTSYIPQIAYTLSKFLYHLKEPHFSPPPHLASGTIGICLWKRTKSLRGGAIGMDGFPFYSWRTRNSTVRPYSLV